jgi:mannose-6-phosphate isomerase-like protein (cupin superfamily)
MTTTTADSKKKYFIDLDNTLCRTVDGLYHQSIPIEERIERVRMLKLQGHHITIWTARGAKSGIDYMDLTLKQLKEWNVPYDCLSMEKPDYDVYIDDKSFHVDSYWKIPGVSPSSLKKKETPVTIMKDWGKEVVITNNEKYCGKILCFHAGYSGSMHYHLKKQETWYIAEGRIILSFPDPATGKLYSEIYEKGDVVTHTPGEAHQVYALEETQIFEVSTTHEDCDSYRIAT